MYKYEYNLWKKETRQTLANSCDDMSNPTLEHISPLSPQNNCKCDDKDSYRQKINTLGNLLLIPKSDNSAGSNNFNKKCREYEKLSALWHVKEVKDEVCAGAWGRGEELMEKRTEKLKKFMLEELAAEVGLKIDKSL